MNCCDNSQKELINFLKIISDENRLKILCILKSGERCVCEIWQELKLPQNLVSHHLKVLKDFELLDMRKEGLNVHYSLNTKNINKYQRELNNYLL